MNDKKFVQGAFVGGMIVAMVAIAIAVSGCATLQQDIPTKQALEYDILSAYTASSKTFNMYKATMPASHRSEALAALNKVYGLLQTYRALTNVDTERTQDLIEAKDNMIDIIAQTTGVTP